jgi:hypothetical protein
MASDMVLFPTGICVILKLGKQLILTNLNLSISELEVVLEVTSL